MNFVITIQRLPYSHYFCYVLYSHYFDEKPGPLKFFEAKENEHKIAVLTLIPQTITSLMPMGLPDWRKYSFG